MIWLLLWILSVPLQAQITSPGPASATNRVLELDGTNSWVELPSGLFTHLTAATVEGWVKWETLGNWARFFDFGDARATLAVSQERTGAGLEFEAWPRLAGGGRPAQPEQIAVAGAIQPGRWLHIAAVTGPDGMRLYVDGLLAATNAYPGSFAAVASGRRNLLGRNLWKSLDPLVTDLHGQMDDIRVWDHARTTEQIRAGMFTRLGGREPGLVGWWNFDDGTANDATSAANHGRMVGQARTVPGELPTPDRHPTPMLIYGQLPAGMALSAGPSILELRVNGQTAWSLPLDRPSGFRLLLPATSQTQEFVVFHPTRSTLPYRLLSTPGATHECRLEVDPAGSDLDSRIAFVGALDRLLRQDPDALQAFDVIRLLMLQETLKPLTPTLLTLLQTGQGDSRALAAILLGVAGQSSVPVVEALGRAAESESLFVRVTALLALKTLAVPESLRAVYEKRTLAAAYLFCGLLLAFTLTHLFLYLLLPRQPTNLFYALFGLTAALLTYLGGKGVSNNLLWTFTVLAFALLGLRLLYALFYPRLPRLFWGFLVLALAWIGWFWLLRDSRPAPESLIVGGMHLRYTLQSGIAPSPEALGAGALLFFMFVEMLRVVVVSAFRKKEGARLIGFGFLTLTLSWIALPVFYILLFARVLGVQRATFLADFVPNAGVVVFVGCTSIHLARNYARLYRELRRALGEIEEKNTELAAARQQAEQARHAADAASQAKSRFLASMSHELRTPLNAIIGYSEMLQEEAADTGTAAFVPDLQKIQTAAKHQLSLINDILDLSKIEAGKMTLFLEPFEIAKLVAEVVTTAEPLVARKHNRLEVLCPPDVGSMRTDQTKVRQVLFNLLSNAAKFTENGVIRLEVGRAVSDRRSLSGGDARASAVPLEADRGLRITFRVSDTGIGMTPEQLGRLFQAFQQAETSTQAKYGGTGLGLAISRKFCQMLGGDISVESALGRGSAFTATLPVCAPEPPPK